MLEQILSHEERTKPPMAPAHTAEQRLADHLNAVIDAQVRRDADRGQAFLTIEKERT